MTTATILEKKNGVCLDMIDKVSVRSGVVTASYLFLEVGRYARTRQSPPELGGKKRARMSMLSM